MTPFRILSTGDEDLPIRWATWTPHARTFLWRWSDGLDELPGVREVELSTIADYPHTYTLAHREIRDRRLRDGLHDFAVGLSKVRAPRKLVLLRSIFDEVIDGRTLRSVFAAARSFLAAHFKEPRAALYVPPPADRRGGAFPLHADLWFPELLLNVYDDVPNDGSGSSVFLQSSTLKRIVRRCLLVPTESKREIVRCLTGPHRDFDYETLYDLLHDRKNAWAAELEARMTVEATEVTLGAGEGYLLHDRRWLHGRASVSRAVGARRLHRLVFHSRDTWPREVA